MDRRIVLDRRNDATLGVAGSGASLQEGLRLYQANERREISAQSHGGWRDFLSKRHCKRHKYSSLSRGQPSLEGYPFFKVAFIRELSGCGPNADRFHHRGRLLSGVDDAQGQ